MATQTVDEIVIGDRIRMSVGLIKGINKLPDHMSKVVVVKEIRVEDDGTRILMVQAEGV
jgi:hypothetical protein